MDAQTLYGRYRKLLVELAQDATGNRDWPRDLDALVERFRSDTATLDNRIARLLREELCEQLEFSGNAATNDVARRVFRAALKKIELIS